MKLTTQIFIAGIVLLANCSDQPKLLSGKTETIEVCYVNWACDCADFMETRLMKESPLSQPDEKNFIFIEPANANGKVPDSFYSKGHFESYLKLTGQFYTEEGIPASYEQKTPEKPAKAKIFRYVSFELVPKPALQNAVKHK